MTRKRDLKRRVRERQAQTGESFVTALRNVRARRSPPFVSAVQPATPQAPAASGSAGPIPVVEMIDLTEVGASLGFKCQIAMSPTLTPKVDPAATLERLREVLLTTASDRALDPMRAIALDGHAPDEPLEPHTLDALVKFLERVRVGIGGVGRNGRMLAMNVDGKHGAEMVLFVAMVMPPIGANAPRCRLTFGQILDQVVEPEGYEPETFYVRMMRGWMVIP